jgi:hypothetical protein
VKDEVRKVAVHKQRLPRAKTRGRRDYLPTTVPPRDPEYRDTTTFQITAMPPQP